MLGKSYCSLQQFDTFFCFSPLAYLDPLSCNLTHMLVQLFKDSLNEYAYAAELAGLKWELVNTKYGLIVWRSLYTVFGII